MGLPSSPLLLKVELAAEIRVTVNGSTNKLAVMNE
jgi:hypothetical protein